MSGLAHTCRAKFVPHAKSYVYEWVCEEVYVYISFARLVASLSVLVKRVRKVSKRMDSDGRVALSLFASFMFSLSLLRNFFFIRAFIRHRPLLLLNKAKSLLSC